MQIRTFSLQNYKGFLNHAPVSLSPGLNVVVGKNNSGKTALLEALSLAFDNQPHISSLTKPRPDSRVSMESFVECVFAIDRDEFVSILQSSSGEFFVPFSQSTHRSPQIAVQRFFESIMEEEEFLLSSGYGAGGNVVGGSTLLVHYAWGSQASSAIHVKWDPGEPEPQLVQDNWYSVSPDQLFTRLLAQILPQRVIDFAQRDLVSEMHL